jgi:hypothetical protein
MDSSFGSLLNTCQGDFKADLEPYRLYGVELIFFPEFADKQVLKRPFLSKLNSHISSFEHLFILNIALIFHQRCTIVVTLHNETRALSDALRETPLTRPDNPQFSPSKPADHDPPIIVGIAKEHLSQLYDHSITLHTAVSIDVCQFGLTRNIGCRSRVVLVLNDNNCFTLIARTCLDGHENESITPPSTTSLFGIALIKPSKETYSRN